MNAEFNWWLLIVGIVVGAILTWLVVADSARREHDILDHEVPAEAGWLARTLADEGIDVDPAVTEAMLRAHRRYLGLPPPDAFVDPETLERIDVADEDPPAEPRPERPDAPAAERAPAPLPDRSPPSPPQAPQARPERGTAR